MRKQKLKPNQVNYSRRNAMWVPIINCVVAHKGEIIVVKRSSQLRHYSGYWNGISGYLDDAKTLREKTEEELKEELHISPSKIVRIEVGQVFDHESREYDKTWITHPVFVEVKDRHIKLNWEANDYRWILPKDAFSLRIVPGFDRVLAELWKWLADIR